MPEDDLDENGDFLFGKGEDSAINNDRHKYKGQTCNNYVKTADANTSFFLYVT